MATPPSLTETRFEEYTGETYSTSEKARIDVLAARARRNLLAEVDVSDVVWLADSDTDEEWLDALSELTWLYFEAEKAKTMEIIAMPLTQLSLGTLFWTKSKGDETKFLPTLRRVIQKYGVSGNMKITLEGELGYV